LNLHAAGRISRRAHTHARARSSAHCFGENGHGSSNNKARADEQPKRKKGAPTNESVARARARSSRGAYAAQIVGVRTPLSVFVNFHTLHERKTLRKPLLHNTSDQLSAGGRKGVNCKNPRALIINYSHSRSSRASSARLLSAAARAPSSIARTAWRTISCANVQRSSAGSFLRPSW